MTKELKFKKLTAGLGYSVRMNTPIEKLSEVITNLDQQLRDGSKLDSATVEQVRKLVESIEWRSEGERQSSIAAAAMFAFAAIQEEADTRSVLHYLERRLNSLRAYVLRSLGSVPLVEPASPPITDVEAAVGIAV